MPIPLDEAEKMFSEPKVLLKPFEWITPSKSGRNQLCLEVAATFESGSLRRGLIFRCVAYPTHLSSYTFQLDCEQLDARQRVALYRLEVLPFRPHVNKCYGGDDLSGRYFEAYESHEHDFHDSLTPNGELRKNACEQARAIEDSLGDFSSAMLRVCSRINIINGVDVPQPPTQGALF